MKQYNIVDLDEPEVVLAGPFPASEIGLEVERFLRDWDGPIGIVLVEA
jgi:hypothetical protein